MNMLLQTLRTPWIASPRSSRWLAVVVLGICGISAVIAAHALDGKAAYAIAALVLGAGVGVWVWLVAINALFMARDAITLRLPHVRRAANASMVWHVVLLVLLPVPLFSLAMGHPLAWLECFTLATALALLFLLLPGWLVFTVIIGQGAVANMHIVHFKTPTPHQLVLDLIAPTLVLAAVAAWRWFALQRTCSEVVPGLGRPVLWGLRLQSLNGASLRDRGGDALLARSSRTWLAPVANLRGTGPCAPIRSLRVALGRNAMPKTAASLIRQWGYSLAFFTVIVGVQMLSEGSSHDLRQIFIALIMPQHGGFGLPVMLAGMFALMPVLISGWPLKSRWSNSATELPLLALLPGLGDRVSARRNVIAACLTSTLQIVAGELVLLIALAAWAHALAQALPLIVLCCASSAAWSAACVLGVVGNKALSGTAIAVLTVLLAVLSCLAMYVGFTHDEFANTRWPLALALLLMLAIFCAWSARGWRALTRRPHPFLASI